MLFPDDAAIQYTSDIRAPGFKEALAAVNMTYQVMRLPGNIAMNSHDFKKCKTAKAAALAQPAANHAVIGTLGQ